MTEKIRILIVEDEALVAEDLKEMLLGIRVRSPRYCRHRRDGDCPCG